MKIDTAFAFDEHFKTMKYYLNPAIEPQSSQSNMLIKINKF